MESKDDSQKVRIAITRIMQDLGVPANIRGYQYLREAIAFAFYHPGAVHSMIKTLYPEVAMSFNTTPSNVQRGISGAISRAWKRGNIESMFSDRGGPIYNLSYKPTNTQMIAMIADWIQLHAGGGQLEESGRPAADVL